MKIIYIAHRVFTAAISCILSSTVFADGAELKSLPQKHLEGTANKEGIMLTVEYTPAMYSKPHRHDSHVFIYVLEG